MNLKLSLILFLILGFTSCDSKAQQPDNTKPMYGEVPKSSEHISIDNDFIKESIRQYGTIDSTVYVYTDYAWRYFYNNDLKTAMKRFNQSWLLNPEHPDSYFGFAALLEMNGNKNDSQRFYKLGFEKDINKSRAVICFQRIADCKEQLKDYEGTIEAYMKIAELDPENSLSYKKIGYLNMQLKNKDNSLKAYNKAIELDPNDAVTYNNRAYLYQNNDDLENAILDYSKAIELDSKYISAYVNRGISQMQKNNFETAKKDFEVCIKLDSKSGELRRMLGMAKLRLNDSNGACKDFEIAKKFGDEYANELIKQNCK
jgi:tetratricopeptide (TPR) repeat protein